MATKKFIDMTGKVFDRLIVLERSPSRIRKDGKRSTMWKCKCSCGTVKDVSGHSLRDGCTASCGCLADESRRKRKEPDVNKRLYNLKRYEADRRNLAFTLTYEEFMKIVLSDCYYCGLPPSQLYKVIQTKEKDKLTMWYSGIDRVENSIGYTPDNSVPCCTHCNQMKLAYGYEEFLDKIEAIYNKLCLSRMRKTA